MFDTARKALEAAAWHRKRKPWEFATDPATGRKFYYNTRTLESRWYMPILDRETGELPVRVTSLSPLHAIVSIFPPSYCYIS